MASPAKDDVRVSASASKGATRLNTQGAMFKYCLISGLYWLAACPFGYNSTFLLGRDISATQVGLTLTAGNALALVLQPFVASNADDDTKGFSIQQLGIGLSVGLVIALGLTNVVSSNVLLSIFMACAIALNANLPGLQNSISVYYINRGADINYGFARGIGSLTWAVMAVVMGQLMAEFTTDVTIKVAFFMAFIILASFFLMPTPKGIPPVVVESPEAKADDELAQASGSYADFLREHSSFILVVLGFCLCFACSSILFVYAIRIIERVGGSAENLGIAMGISAASELPAMWGMDWLRERVRISKIMKFAAIGYVIRHAVLFFAGSMSMVYLGYGLQAIAFAVYTPASVHYCNHYFGEGDKNKALGLMVMVSSISGMVSNIIGGVMVDAIGVMPSLGIFTALSAVGAAIVFIGVSRQEKAVK